MSLQDWVKLAAEILGGLGLAGIGIGTLLYYSKKTTQEERKAVTDSATTLVEFWKTQAEEYKSVNATIVDKFNKKIEELTADFNKQIQDLTKEVGTLTGQLNAEKSQNEKLEQIFANRDPQTQEFMKLLTNAALESQKFMAEDRAEEKKKMEMWDGMIKLLADTHKYSAEIFKMMDSRGQTVKIEGTMESVPALPTN